MSFGAPGSGSGELRRPSGVAVDGQGDVYVADWGSNARAGLRPFGGPHHHLYWRFLPRVLAGARSGWTPAPIT